VFDRSASPPAARAVAGRAGLGRGLVTAAALGFFALFLLLPLAAVFSEALAEGWRVYLAALRDPEAWAAIRLSLAATAGAVALNTGFGLAAGWLLGKHRFPGRRLLTVLLDLPFAVSPVVAGLVFMLLFGAQGWFGPWLMDRDIRVIFAFPGILLATSFVTFPFVARELAPVFQAQGPEQEEAARLLGASGWQTFWRVSLPGAKWGLVYGVILCSARALGEFGAVSVVSGHIRGQSETLPLHIEALYNEYQFSAAFACASLLTLLALATLLLKTWVARRRGEPALSRSEP
jgi:sulfate transport system permease protein